MMMFEVCRSALGLVFCFANSCASIVYAIAASTIFSLADTVFSVLGKNLITSRNINTSVD